jgi:hypothetical protein
MTGSAEGARMFAIANPTLPSDQVTFWNTFNWQAFQLPVPCSWTRQTTACFGNAGNGSIINVPTFMNNWDMSLAKNFPLKGERRALIFRAEFYNLPNHTQFSGINSAIQYDLGSYQKWINGQGSLVQSNNQLGRFTSARNPRQIALTLRLQF